MLGLDLLVKSFRKGSIRCQAPHQIFHTLILETRSAQDPETVIMVSGNVHIWSEAEHRASIIARKGSSLFPEQNGPEQKCPWYTHRSLD